MGTNYTSPGWEDAGNIQLARSQNGGHGVVIVPGFVAWALSDDVQRNLKEGIHIVADGAGVIVTADSGYEVPFYDPNNWSSWENLLEQ